MIELDSGTVYVILIVVAIVAIVATLITIMVLIFKSPFHYPYFSRYFDVSGKRNPQVFDSIDKFLNSTNFHEIQKHNELVLHWKQCCQKRIENSKIKKYRQKQFKVCLDDNNAFRFFLTYKQTRYKQKNYIKTPYTVTQIKDSFFCGYAWLEDRNKQLEDINYECTLQEYHNNSQRKLMTKELRKRIMIRDNYTCQNCGKYMPDEVGLQIDHICPVSKGGKTVSSNLQVLCSKCNGNKSNRV